MPENKAQVSKREKTKFDCFDVLLVIRKSGSRARVWSSIAAEILGIERSRVTMVDVRGVQDCTNKLLAADLIVEDRRSRFVAANRGTTDA